MSFKDIPYLELWQFICLAEQNHFCNFGRGYHEEHSCEIILNWTHVVQEEMSFEEKVYTQWTHVG